MIVIEKEEFSDSLFAEFLPLAQKCWEESTAVKGESCAFVGKRDFPIEPDTELYRGLAARKVLVILMVRDDGKAVGYAVGYTGYSSHHRKILCGYGDSIYLEPKYRALVAIELLKRLESELAGLGAIAMGWPVSQNGPLYALLSHLGFVGDDIIMEKILCAS